MTSCRLVRSSCLWVFMLSGLTWLARSETSSDCQKLSGLDLALLADATESVGIRNFKLMKEFLKTLVSDSSVSEDRTHVAVMTYHEVATVINNFADKRSSSQQDLLKMIENTPNQLGSKTFIDRALFAAEEKLFSAAGGDRENVPNVLVLFTDGKTSKLSRPYEEIIPRLKAKGVHIVAVGIGTNIFRNELQKIAGENVLMVRTFNQLPGKLRDLEIEICAIDGGYTEWSCWTDCSAMCGRGRKTHTRTCTNPPPMGDGKDCSAIGEVEETTLCNDFACQSECHKLSGLDLALVADTTESVGAENFQIVKDFLKSLVNDLPVSGDRTHIAVITFHNQAKVINNFASGSSSSRQDLLNLIDNIPNNLGSTTFTDRALIAAEEQLFSAAGGNRRDVPNALVLFTDGRTNEASRPYAKIVSSLKAKGVHIVAVGIGRKIYKSELQEIAGEDVLMVEEFPQLPSKLKELEVLVCGGYAARRSGGSEQSGGEQGGSEQGGGEQSGSERSRSGKKGKKKKGRARTIPNLFDILGLEPAEAE